ncbi:SLOG family protein [Enterococcus sp. LJL99]
MELVKTLYITGYRSFEIAVFQENDPKITVIKNVLKNEIISYLENGLEWILVSGNLGVEMWAAEVVGELKNDYPELKLGLIYPFQGFGENWNEKNQLLLKKVESLSDYVNAVSHQPYQSPAQLKMHTNFLLNHTGASLLIYDQEYPGKTAYFLKDCESFSEKNLYEIRLITMLDLQNSTEE